MPTSKADLKNIVKYIVDIVYYIKVIGKFSKFIENGFARLKVNVAEYILISKESIAYKNYAHINAANDTGTLLWVITSAANEANN